MTEDRIPPFSEEAERGVLGSILLDGIMAVDTCIESKLTPDAFYVPAHRLIYEAMVELAIDNYPIDALTISDNLRKKHNLDKVGGSTFLDNLIDQTPSATSCEFYAELVRKQWLRRQVINMSREAEETAFEIDDPDQLIADVEAKLLSIDLGRRRERTNREVARDVAARIRKAQEKKFTGVPSVFPSLNNRLLGYDELIILAGRPSTGKTTLMLNEIPYQAKAGYRPALATIESSKEECFLRICSAWTGVTMMAMKSGRLGKEEQVKVMDALSDIAKLDMYITDDPHTVESLGSWARRMKMRHDIGILWIDHLQNIHSSTRTRSRNDEVDEQMLGIQKLRKQIGIPVVVLSQLSRAMETGQSPRKPRLSDLRDSGAIEQIADIVLLLSHSVDDPSLTLADIAKQRNGPTGELMLKKVFQYMRFEEIEEINEGYQTDFESHLKD